MNEILDGAQRATLVLMRLMPARTRLCPLNEVVAGVIIHCEAPWAAEKAGKALYKSDDYYYYNHSADTQALILRFC